MGNRWRISLALLCTLTGILIILFCFYCSPEDLGRYMGFEGAIDSAHIVHIKAVRLGAVIAGFMVFIWGIALAIKPHLWETVDKWFQDSPPKTRNLIALAILLALACACYLPFTYDGVFGERDSYRMLCGLLDSLNTGTPYANSTLYARHHSFGYYAWLYLFSDTVRQNPHAAFAVFNYTSTIAAILMVIPLFFVVLRYWGLGAAILSNFILMMIPVWWRMSLYGHPQLIAVFFNFVGLALLCYRQRLASGALEKAKTIAIDLLIIASFSLCLANRLDCVLMFPLILAVLIYEGHSFKAAVFRFAAYTVPPVIFFIIGDSALPSAAASTSSPLVGTFALLWRYHNPAKLVENFREANHIFISAYPGFLLFSYLLACFYLIRKRKYSSLLFILPVVLINYVFWLPSPFPARHFVYLAPVLAVGIALLLAFIARQAADLISNNKLKTYSVVFLFFICGYLSTSLIDGIPIFKGVYSPDQAITAGRLGEDLMKMPIVRHPVFVVSDAVPVIVNMQLNSDSIKIATSDHHTLVVNNGKNEFIFCVQGWNDKNVSNLYEKAEKCDKMEWLVDPYNDFIYNKMKNFKPASTHP